MTPSLCRVCAKPLEQPRIGRKRKFCSKACARKDERRRAAIRAQNAAGSRGQEAESSADSKANPRRERVPPREDDAGGHLSWWEIERLGLGSGGYWVGSERPPWR